MYVQQNINKVDIFSSGIHQSKMNEFNCVLFLTTEIHCTKRQNIFPTVSHMSLNVYVTLNTSFFFIKDYITVGNI